MSVVPWFAVLLGLACVVVGVSLRSRSGIILGGLSVACGATAIILELTGR